MLATTEEANEYRKKFHSYYNSQIKPELETLEEKRKKRHLKYSILRCFMWISLLAMVAFLIYLIYKNAIDTNFWNNEGQNIFKPGLIITSFPAVCCFIFARMFKEITEQETKLNVMNLFVSFFGDLKWMPPNSQYEYFIERSKLINNDYSSIKLDDDFAGTFQNNLFSISEVKIIRNFYLLGKYAGSNIHFKGLFIKVDMNKRIGSNVIVTEKLLTKNVITKLYNHLPQHFEGLHQTSLEDVDFNKQFNVYTNDEIEARYILTTAFLERFKALKQIFNAKEIRASFFDDTLVIALSCDKDMFLLGDIRTSMTDSNEIQTLFEEFMAVLSIVEVLNLTSKTGL